MAQEEAAKFKESSKWFQRFKKRHTIVLRRRTNKKKVWTDDGRDTIQKFHRDLRKALKTQRRSNKSYTVDPKYGRWIPKNTYNIDQVGSLRTFSSWFCRNTRYIRTKSACTRKTRFLLSGFLQYWQSPK